MMVKSGGKNRADIVAGDILCAKSDGSKMVFDAADYASIPSSWYSIGIVVIPPSHDVYGTGEGAAVSLKYMSCNKPNDGTTSFDTLNWGQNNVDTSLTNFSRVNVTTNTHDPTITTYYSGYLPSDNFTGTQCVTDPIAYYWGSTDYIPSPYLSNGSRNKDYHTTNYSYSNALSDFDGIGNTDVLCSLATVQSDWKTASTIIDNYESGYSPAACCCWRYHTIGTNQGDWYLPASGELGYLMVRFKTIDNSIRNVGGAPLDMLNGTWSSSEYSSDYALILSTYDGIIGNSGKGSAYKYARSFLHF